MVYTLFYSIAWERNIQKFIHWLNWQYDLIYTNAYYGFSFPLYTKCLLILLNSFSISLPYAFCVVYYRFTASIYTN